MLTLTYVSVKNSELKKQENKQRFSNKQVPLLRDNFLGEYITDLDKKKVLVNLGINTSGEENLDWEIVE